MSTTTEQMIITAPESHKLPGFLVPSIKYNEARASLGTALIVEAEAKRMADISRNWHLAEALDCLEKQVFYPFTKLLDADRVHHTEKGERLLTDDERDLMDCYISDVKRYRMSRTFPEFNADESSEIAGLLRKYAAAINEQKGMSDYAGDGTFTEDEIVGYDWRVVHAHMIAANASAVRAAD